MVDTCLSCEDIPLQIVEWCPYHDFFASFLHPIFSVSGVQHISDLHSKFALRPLHVCNYGRHRAAIINAAVNVSCSIYFILLQICCNININTRHRASTSMYSLKFCIRIATSPQYDGRNGMAHATGVSILSPVRGVFAARMRSASGMQWA